MSPAKLSDNFYDKIKPRLHERIGRELAGSKHVLDLGCGDCGLARYLADSHGQQVTGVDISGESFPNYQDIAQNNKNIKCIRKDAENLKSFYGTMDVVVIMWALHEMKNPQVVLQEVHRVLRPGGKVLVVEFPRDSLAQKLWNENYYTSEELTDSLRKAGFKGIRAERIEHKQILWVNGYRDTN